MTRHPTPQEMAERLARAREKREHANTIDLRLGHWREFGREFIEAVGIGMGLASLAVFIVAVLYLGLSL